MKRFVVIVMLTSLVVMSSLPVPGVKSKVKLLGNFDFQSNKVINVIVTFNEPAVTEYETSLMYKVTSFFNTNATNAYATKIESSHKSFESLINSLNGHLNFSYTYTLNGVSCSIKESDIPRIATYNGVSGVFEDTTAYLERETLTKVIQSDAVNKMKDSSGNYITGKGVLVGIVDTGVDYTDKELGGGSFPNSKVIGGYDFADNDPDPKDSDGHGTHVAGIIAGSIYGVAPDAKIMAYKVFSGDNNSTSVSTIIKGIDQAVKDKCNIINISIGTVGGSAFGNDPESISVRNAANSGVIVVAASGNKGAPSDTVNFPMSSPASVKEVIGVGATDDSITGIITISQQQIYGSYPGECPPFTEGSYNFVYCGLGESIDFQGKDLKGKIALVQRGKIYFGDKDLNAKKAGAVGIIVFNNVSGIPKIELVSQNNPGDTDFIPFLFVSFTDSILLKENSSLQVSIQNKYGLGRIADFSSSGPTTDFFLKPDMVAPGVNISSTLPGDKIGVLSGTSMASPVVAGVSALLKQVRPNLTAEDDKALMMNSSDVLINPYSGLPFSPLLQGAGRINAMNVVNSNYIVKPASLMFGNGETSKSVSFTIKNLSTSAGSFFTSYQFASNDKISINLPFTISVPANGTATFTVTFSAPSNVSESYGYISIKGSQSINLHVPFVYLSQIPTPALLSNVKVSSQTLTPQNPLNIKFTVGMGEDISDDTSTFKGNIAEEIKVDIYNAQGAIVDTIFDQSPIYTGDYSLNMPLMDSLQNSKYANGIYYYKVEYINATEDEKAKLVLPTTVVASSSGKFSVVNAPQNVLSILPQGGYTLLLKNGKEFWVDVYIDSQKPEMSLNFLFNFDPFYFTVLDCQEGKKLSDDTTFTSDIENGLIAVTLTSDSASVINKGVLVSIKLRATENGSGYLDVSSVKTTSLSKFAMPKTYYNISDYPTYFDLNGDNIINNLDLNIFKASYMKKQGDTGYNSLCDLNFDGVVNSTDFFILSEHFGEHYP